MSLLCGTILTFKGRREYPPETRDYGCPPVAFSPSASNKESRKMRDSDLVHTVTAPPRASSASQEPFTWRQVLRGVWKHIKNSKDQGFPRRLDREEKQEKQYYGQTGCRVECPSVAAEAILVTGPAYL